MLINGIDIDSIVVGGVANPPEVSAPSLVTIRPTGHGLPVTATAGDSMITERSWESWLYMRILSMATVLVVESVAFNAISIFLSL